MSTWNALLGIYQRKDDFLKIGQLDDTDATPRIEHQQIRIASDNSASATGQSQCEKFIVVGIAAVTHLFAQRCLGKHHRRFAPRSQ